MVPVTREIRTCGLRVKNDLRFHTLLADIYLPQPPQRGHGSYGISIGLTLLEPRPIDWDHLRKLG